MKSNVNNEIANEEAEIFQRQISEANISEWNSSSSFSGSGRDTTNIMVDDNLVNDGCGVVDPDLGLPKLFGKMDQDEASLDVVGPVDQIGRGGGAKLCPINQIGRGGTINSATLVQDPKNPTREGTPKRKFSPMDNSPVGRVRKMSTPVHASPHLRNQMVPYCEGQALSTGAPDLFTGIGRLQIRGNPVAPVDGVSTLEVTGHLPQDEGITQNVFPVEPVNVIERLMRRTPRNRTLSNAGGYRNNNKKKTPVQKRRRAHSLTSQKRIDILFGQDQRDKDTEDLEKLTPLKVKPSDVDRDRKLN